MFEQIGRSIFWNINEFEENEMSAAVIRMKKRFKK